MLPVDVFNFDFDDLQALLDIDQVVCETPRFLYAGGQETGIGDEPATLIFSFNTSGAEAGQYIAPITIYTSDEDLPGEMQSTIELTIIVTIDDSPPIPGDLDGNGTVNVTDLLILLGNWGNAGLGDINNDGTVNVTDLLIHLGNWG